MASQQLTSTRQEELVCPICTDILKEPVTIDSGHNFCLTCISQIGEASDSFLKCPLCQNSVKRTTFRYYWLLASLVEKIQTVDPTEIQPEVEERKCQRHGERFNYFCEQDWEFLCVLCHHSKDHKTHNARFIEETAQKYQIGIWASSLHASTPFPRQRSSVGILRTVTCSSWLRPTGPPLALE
jgi:hypothetical protein